MDSVESSHDCTRIQLWNLLREIPEAVELLDDVSNDHPLVPQMLRLFYKIVKSVDATGEIVHAVMAGLVGLFLYREDNVDAKRYGRCHLFKRFMERISCIGPESLQELTDNLLKNLDGQGLGSEINVLAVAIGLSASTKRAQGLSICLLWSILTRRLDGLGDIDSHRIRKLKDLVVVIRDDPPGLSELITTTDLTDANKINMRILEVNSFNNLLDTISQLINLTICPCPELRDSGYPPELFDLSMEDISVMLGWSKDILRKFPPADDDADEELFNSLDNLLQILRKIRYAILKSSSNNMSDDDCDAK
ncbi:hypothetical protein KR018_003118 [Drosophila ironensis]|nr:hypothetical protein KR018_003118 [Drosophila ironensis]